VLLKHDKNIYRPCIGPIVLDIGVIAGVLVYGWQLAMSRTPA